MKNSEHITVDYAELAREVVAALFYESATSELVDPDDVERITTVIGEYFADHQPAPLATEPVRSCGLDGCLWPKFIDMTLEEKPVKTEVEMLADLARKLKNRSE